MDASGREPRLDALKTLACMLMVFAHSRTYGRTIDCPVTTYFWYAGFFAPVLFMGAMGWGLSFQMGRRSARELIIFYVALLAITLPYWGSKGHYPQLVGGLFFTLALTAMCCVVLPRVTTQGWAVAVPVCVFYVGHALGVPPTPLTSGLFSLFPWMYFVLLGRHLGAHPDRKLPYAIVGGIVACVALLFGQTMPDQTASVLFLSLGTTVYCMSLLAVDHAGAILRWSFVGWLGRGTLAFLFVHTAFIRSLPFALPAPAMWSLVFVFSVSALWILQQLNARTLRRLSGKPLFWALAFALELAPLLGSWSRRALVTYSFAWLLAFSLNYSGLFVALRNVPWLARRVDARDDLPSATPVLSESQ